MAVPGRDAPSGHADPLAELARLVGNEDPFRGVFRPAPVPAEQAGDGQALRYGHDAPYPAEAGPDPYHDDGHDYADQPYADHAVEDGHGHPDDAGYHAQHHADADLVYDDRYAAAQDPRHDEAGLADERFAVDAAAATALPDIWAQGSDGSDAPPIDGDAGRPALGDDRRSSARRPLAVLAAVLVLTAGGLAASFLAKGPSSPGVAAATSGRSAPTIMAATGPTKVKVEDAGATAPEDQDAALLNKNGNVSSGPVKIVSSQEQPVDLGQLPKTSDLAAGARPLPPATPSPFPEPKKVKTFVVHPDGTMLSADGAAAASSSSDGAGSALPATPKTVATGGTTPKSAAPDSIAALAASPAADAAPTPAKPARQPASPGARTASAKLNDTADAPNASGGGFGVQLASSPVEADANAAFAKLKKKYPAQLGSLTASIHRAETGDKPVYRVRVGSMSQDEAKTLCSQLHGAGGSCFVVHN